MSGLKFFAGYPITPASDLMEYLSERLPKYGGVVFQAEDELAAINAIIGASWAGAKAMTATSGPGLSLMAESIGFAAMVEAPIVIVNNMRVGPSTGIATMPSQGDVFAARWNSHGPYPVVVYAPTSAQEAFDLTVKAFNTAEKLRVPVILLQDAALAHTRETVVIREPPEIEIINRKKPDVPPERYKPFEPDPNDLVPPMAVYGEGYYVSAESLVHDERGYYVTSNDVYRRLVSRLLKKLEVHIKAFARANADNPDFSAILMREMASGGVNMPTRAREQMQRILFLLNKTLELGKSDNVFKAADPLIIHFMIVGTINLFVTSIPLRNSLPETDQCNQMQNSDIESAAEQV
ncbi:TPA: hypothetical protein EYP38_04095, partial [Candidatus Micrarchaeota archaeon]|nr:hypothetical protein [Candidatus Micrarchaeota archaeon]